MINYFSIAVYRRLSTSVLPSDCRYQCRRFWRFQNKATTKFLEYGNIGYLKFVETGGLLKS